MNDIWNKDHRNGKVSQKTVSFLDQCQKPELCDAKINQTADQCNDNLTGGDAFSGVYVRSFCFWCPGSYIIFAGQGPFFKSVGYTFHHGGNHIYGGGYGTEDNQNGN